MIKKNEYNNFMEELYSIVRSRDNSKIESSYTKFLLKKGPKKIAKKIGEESVELIVDYLSGSKKRVVEEAADLIYHIIVLLYSKKITIKNLEKELEKRKSNVRQK